MFPRRGSVVLARRAALLECTGQSGLSALREAFEAFETAGLKYSDSRSVNGNCFE